MGVMLYLIPQPVNEGVAEQAEQHGKRKACHESRKVFLLGTLPEQFTMGLLIDHLLPPLFCLRVDQAALRTCQKILFALVLSLD